MPGYRKDVAKWIKYWLKGHGFESCHWYKSVIKLPNSSVSPIMGTWWDDTILCWKASLNIHVYRLQPWQSYPIIYCFFALPHAMLHASHEINRFKTISLHTSQYFVDYPSINTCPAWSACLYISQYIMSSLAEFPLFPCICAPPKLAAIMRMSMFEAMDTVYNWNQICGVLNEQIGIQEEFLIVKFPTEIWTHIGEFACLMWRCDTHIFSWNPTWFQTKGTKQRAKEWFLCGKFSTEI